MDDLKKRLNKYFKEGGNKTQFCKDNKINRTHLYAILNKEKNPTWDTVKKIAKGLGLEVKFVKKEKMKQT